MEAEEICTDLVPRNSFLTLKNRAKPRVHYIQQLVNAVHAENRYFVGKIRSNCLLNQIIHLVATGF
jgi:hypothetical protein